MFKAKFSEITELIRLPFVKQNHIINAATQFLVLVYKDIQ